MTKNMNQFVGKRCLIRMGYSSISNPNIKEVTILEASPFGKYAKVSDNIKTSWIYCENFEIMEVLSDLKKTQKIIQTLKRFFHV